MPALDVLLIMKPYTMMKLYLLFFILTQRKSNSQVIPSHYTTRNFEVMPVNGSSSEGLCSQINTNGVTSTCTDPTSSVLFDGVIPTLTGLGGDMWASQLLTLQASDSPFISFSFVDTPGYAGLSGRLEMVLFNCPPHGISVRAFRLLMSSASSGPFTSLGPDVDIGITSCDSLVRVCTPITTTGIYIIISFHFQVDAVLPDWVHLAEVTFYANSNESTCPLDAIITTDTTTAPPDTTTASTDTTTASTDTTAASPATTTTPDDTTQLIMTQQPQTATTPQEMVTTPQEMANVTSAIVATVPVVLLVLIGLVIGIGACIGMYCRKKKKMAVTTGHSDKMTGGADVEMLTGVCASVTAEDAAAVDAMLAHVDDTTLNLDDDLGDVVDAVESLASKWRILTTKLHLKESTLDVIERNNPGDVVTCLHKALGEWLKLNYNHQRHGRPSWRRLAEAVSSLDYGLSEKIATMYGARCD